MKWIWLLNRLDIIICHILVFLYLIYLFLNPSKIM